MKHKYIILSTSILYLLSVCQPYKIVIDTDVGSDDAVALSLILGAEALYRTHQVVGITAIHGNTNVHQVTRNILKVLKTNKRLDIPVYKGANYSILLRPSGDNFFGKDGFGDFEFLGMPSEDVIQRVHAVNYLTTIAKHQPGMINLLCLGPLTNVAMAVRMDEEFMQNIGDITIMGGSSEGLGNVKPGIEFNAYIDPEAAAIVMDEAAKWKKRITMMPWESAVYLNISMDWRKNVLGKVQSSVVALLNNAEKLSTIQKGSWISSDTVTALLLVDKTMPHELLLTHGTTETCGTTSRGTTIIDLRGRYGRIVKHNTEPNVYVVSPGSLSKIHIQNFMLQLFSNYKP